VRGNSIRASRGSPFQTILMLYPREPFGSVTPQSRRRLEGKASPKTESWLPQTAEVPQAADVPEAAEESNTTWTLPVLSSHRAIGVKVVPLAKSLSFSTAQTSR